MTDLLTAYSTACLQHLPPGLAWPRASDSHMAALMRGIATELTRIHDRAQQLIDESLPSHVIDTLERWENDYGLPDKCTPADQTTEERKDALIQKYRIYGSQSREFQITLCEALGCQASITEYTVRRYASTYGTNYSGQDWAFVVQFNIVLPETDNEDGLKQVLECTLRRVLHSHKYAIFNYVTELESEEPAISYPYNLNIVNPGAEDGINGWTVTEGQFQADDYWGTPHGQYYFYAGNTAQSKMYQDLVIPEAANADIDAGLISLQSGFLSNCSGSPKDGAQVSIQFVDAQGGLSSEITGTMWQTAGWTPENVDDYGVIPPGTRKVRLHFLAYRYGGSSNDGYADEFRATLIQA